MPDVVPGNGAAAEAERWGYHFWLRLLGFALVPLLFNAALYMCYFGPWPWGHRLVVPAVSSMHENFDREFGLLENLQNLLLLAVLVGAVVYAVRMRQRPLFLIFGCLVAFGSLVLLLEEIDYGMYWYWWLSGNRPIGFKKSADASFNLHNLGGNAFLKILKQVAWAVLVAAFALLPLATRRWRHRPLVAYFRTTSWYTVTLAVMLICHRVAHGLDDHHIGSRALESNISEFSELNIYYLAMLYCYDVFFRRRMPPEDEPATVAPAA